MRPGIVIAISTIVVTALCFLPGCNKKLTPAESALISTVTLDAQERAAAWDVASPNIHAADAGDSQSVAHFVANQSDSLHKLASGLVNLGTAITEGSNLSANARAALSQEADTAAARASDLRAMMKFIAADATTTAFLNAHQASLDAEAANLASLKAMLAADASGSTSTSTSTK